MQTWKALEESVKIISSFIWNCNAVNETINGVKCDCVLKIRDDYWVIIEVTENETLDKVRTDIAKLSTIKQHLFSKYTYSECYIILKGEPTESMQTTGDGCKVKVMSYNSFSKSFFNFDSYYHIRSQKAFGSSVNPISGDPDQYEYTPVYYENIETKKSLKVNEIAKQLIEGKNIILLGNYGTGKSRCIRELFLYLSKKEFNKIVYPFAINLKEHWGTQRADEIIRRHLGLLGLSKDADSVIKIISSDKFIFLLDGFDEIGAQVWSDDSSKLKQIRASSLSAVKDLINTTKSPLIITGREHYFNSSAEMFQTLGLNKTETLVLRCKDEFTDDEMEIYLKNLSQAIELPFWLPRRPLICQIINTLEPKKIEEIFLDSFSAVEFWNTLITNICERESRISPVLDSNIILKILKSIAYYTRIKNGDVGPLSITEINKAFEKIVGTQPVDESAVMLQRLPGLGRISSESHDRQFIDYYFLDGLRAENLIDIVYQNDLEILNEKWLNPISRAGIEIVAKRIHKDKSAHTFIGFLKQSINSTNRVLAGDLLAALTFYNTNNSIDLSGIILDGSKITFLNFSNSLIDNFIIKDSYVDELDISHYSFSKVIFRDSIIKKLYGISGEKENPSFLSSCIIESYEKNSINFTNRLFSLKPQQMILLSLIKKIFILNTNVKLESDIIKNYGNITDKRIVSEVLKIMHKEKVLTKCGNNGKSEYSAKPHQRARVLQILKDKDKSTDPLWLDIGKLNITILYENGK